MKYLTSLLSSPHLGWLAAALTLALYLTLSAAGGYLGFPLDDAWIHQSYARNLGLYGEFAFLPGQPSAGSTAPLWSYLLSVGYLLRLEPRLWAYLLGGLALGLNAWLAGKLAQQLWPERPWLVGVASLAVALEWHLGWASASGMETVLFAACTLAVFVLPTSRPIGLGLLVGVSMLLRPDGLTLLPLAILRLIENKNRLRAGALVLFGFFIIFLPYLAFNYWLAGAIWPNTFYAKQAEYSILRELPLWQNALNVIQQPLIGGQALLLPGVLALAWPAARQRRWAVLLPLAWVAGYLAAYILRLPVTYQYGRYVLPILPLAVTLGVGGLAQLIRPTAANMLVRVVSRAWLAATVLLWLVFWGLGATFYLRDVRIIETEMVATAKWVAANTPPEAVIGAHDIGALGYFGGRRLLDLAGLISPEVIPFIRDEARLAEWLTASGAQYLVTFPDWYERLAVGREKVFSTDAPYSPAAGGSNMAVYVWP